MPDRRTVRHVVLTIAGILVLVLIVVWLPYLFRTRQVVLATPGPAPIAKTTPIALTAGGTTCVDNVSLDERARALRMRFIAPVGAVGGPLVIVLTDAHGRRVGSVRVPRGFRVPSMIQPAVHTTLRHSTIGKVCIANNGRRLTMQGSDEPRTRTRSNTFVNGTQVVGDLSLEVYGKPSSVASRIGDIFGEAATFKPVTTWEVWVLAVLLLLGVPGGLTFVLVRSLRRP